MIFRISPPAESVVSKVTLLICLKNTTSRLAELTSLKMQRAPPESNYLEPIQRPLISITLQCTDSKTSKLDVAFIYVAGGGGELRFWGVYYR